MRRRERVRRKARYLGVGILRKVLAHGRQELVERCNKGRFERVLVYHALHKRLLDTLKRPVVDP